MKCHYCGKDATGPFDPWVCDSCKKVAHERCAAGWRFCDWCSRGFCEDCKTELEEHADWGYMCKACKDRMKSHEE